VHCLKQKKISTSNGAESRLLYELSNYLSWSGLSDPEHQASQKVLLSKYRICAEFTLCYHILIVLFLQVYILCQQPGPRLSEFLFLAIISVLGKMTFSQTIGIKL